MIKQMASLKILLETCFSRMSILVSLTGFGLSKASPNAIRKHIGIREIARVIGARKRHNGTNTRYIPLLMGCCPLISSKAIHNARSGTTIHNEKNQNVNIIVIPHSQGNMMPLQTPRTIMRTQKAMVRLIGMNINLRIIPQVLSDILYLLSNNAMARPKTAQILAMIPKMFIMFHSPINNSQQFAYKFVPFQNFQGCKAFLGCV